MIIINFHTTVSYAYNFIKVFIFYVKNINITTFQIFCRKIRVTHSIGIIFGKNSIILHNIFNLSSHEHV